MKANKIFFIINLLFGAHCFGLKNSLQRFASTLNSLSGTLQATSRRVIEPSITNPQINQQKIKTQEKAFLSQQNEPRKIILGNIGESNLKVSQENQKREVSKERLSVGFGKKSSQVSKEEIRTIFITQADFDAKKGDIPSGYLCIMLGTTLGTITPYIFKFEKSFLNSHYEKIINTLRSAFLLKDFKSLKLIGTGEKTGQNGSQYIRIKPVDGDVLFLLKNALKKFNPLEIISTADVKVENAFQNFAHGQDLEFNLFSASVVHPRDSIDPFFLIGLSSWLTLSMTQADVERKEGGYLLPNSIYVDVETDLGLITPLIFQFGTRVIDDKKLFDRLKREFTSITPTLNGAGITVKGASSLPARIGGQAAPLRQQNAKYIGITSVSGNVIDKLKKATEEYNPLRIIEITDMENYVVPPNNFTTRKTFAFKVKSIFFRSARGGGSVWEEKKLQSNIND